jgi:hypothetical protein
MPIAGFPTSTPRQISATANIAPRSCSIAGVFCSSSSSGAVTIYDDAATGTTTKVVDTFSVTAGTWYPLPFTVSSGVYVVIGGTASVTVGLV